MLLAGVAMHSDSCHRRFTRDAIARIGVNHVEIIFQTTLFLKTWDVALRVFVIYDLVSRNVRIDDSERVIPPWSFFFAFWWLAGLSFLEIFFNFSNVVPELVHY
jgi:hypothetical protein